tara:strand:+ start:2031 stop:2174 length:144 start_codon:yes stop_codon:yes gene_type:complete
MSYKTMVFVFTFGIAAAFISSVIPDVETLKGNIECQSSEMEAIWYPE